MNPNYNDGKALKPSNPQNEVNPRTFHSHNTFPMSYKHPLTARYGDVTPFYVFEAEPLDKVPFGSIHEVLSDPLKSVNFSDIRMIKDYFSVPFKAIMPNTWDLWYVPPTQGDDVPSDVGCFFSNPLSYFRVGNTDYPVLHYWRNPASDILPLVGSDDYNLSRLLTWLWKSYILNEFFFDDGSLLSLMGCKLSKYWRKAELPTYDLISTWYSDSSNFFERFLSLISIAIGKGVFIQIYTLEEDMKTFTVSPNEFNSNQSLYFRRIIEFLRDNPHSYFMFPCNIVLQDLDEIYSDFPVVGGCHISHNMPINISRLIAYQLSYFHFMTNDKVDFIYSADLYRNTMMGLVLKSQISSSSLSFDYNGLSYQYDVFSNRYLDNILNKVGQPVNLEDDFSNIDIDFPEFFYSFIYLSEIFTIRKSLKYGDYFTGARPRPLAVGDVFAPVTGSGVSAIDMTENILLARFKNAINKTGRKISDFMKSIRGSQTMPLLTDPKFLARDSVQIGMQEVENTTSQNQGKLVSILRSNQSRFGFEVDIEDPCIIIGVVSFDVPLAYSKTIDRQFFVTDRMDMFQPYMQNIGDQEIYAAEKNLGGLDSAFAYTLRHMEYKQRFDVVSGGFVDDLKEMYFVADNIDGNDMEYLNISPEFIRTHNTDFDRYFPVLYGYSPCQYYHFKIKFVNQTNPNRNMEFSPTIL